MYLYVLDNKVFLGLYKINTDTSLITDKLQRHHIYEFGLIAYSSDEKDAIISVLSSFDIECEVENLTYENETLKKVATKQYSSRSEALLDLDVSPLTLDEYKQIKNDSLSDICNAEILGTFTSSAMGEEHIYSFSYDAQINFQGTKQLFSDGLITEIEWSTWDAGNIDHNNTQFNVLYMDGVNHKLSKINKYRMKKNQVNACLSKNEVDAIEW